MAGGDMAVSVYDAFMRQNPVRNDNILEKRC
jgi:hypothetical protein